MDRINDLSAKLHEATSRRNEMRPKLRLGGLTVVPREYVDEYVKLEERIELLESEIDAEIDEATAESGTLLKTNDDLILVRRDADGYEVVIGTMAIRVRKMRTPRGPELSVETAVTIAAR